MSTTIHMQYQAQCCSITFTGFLILRAVSWRETSSNLHCLSENPCLMPSKRNSPPFEVYHIHSMQCFRIAGLPFIQTSNNQLLSQVRGYLQTSKSDFARDIDKLFKGALGIWWVSLVRLYFFKENEQVKGNNLCMNDEICYLFHIF